MAGPPTTASLLAAMLALGLGVLTLAGACSTDLDCSLNGVCSSGACSCDRPWQGTSCGVMGYKVTPASGKNLYNSTDPRNTWNGPIIEGPTGKYHLFDPLYAVGHLLGPTTTLHGTADVVTGPYTWNKLPDLPGHSNPAAVVFPNATTGEPVYSVWLGGKIYVAADPSGPYAALPNGAYPGGNPAPLYHDGAFYMTNQHTLQVYTTKDLTQAWTVHGNISHDHVPARTTPEDPFMWIDKRGNWHIINHAYNVGQKTDCQNSTVSDHFFSPDGRDWHMVVPFVQPYSHVVHFDDGTSQFYVTLERPNIHFNRSGQMTHLTIAADLVATEAGCAPSACTNCKYHDHAGTLIVALDV